MRNVTAHTPATYPYPPYVNVSRHDNHDGVRITVRSGPGDDGSCGHSAFIDLTANEWRAMLADMTKEEYHTSDGEADGTT
jgi:hypothetical protein